MLWRDGIGFGRLYQCFCSGLNACVYFYNLRNEDFSE